MKSIPNILLWFRMIKVSYDLRFCCFTVSLGHVTCDALASAGGRVGGVEYKSAW